MALYEAAGVGRERVLDQDRLHLEGIQAARELEQEGIRCNLTLLFSFCQAVACGQARVQLISPFVGRIYDWAKKAAGAQWDEAARRWAERPGVRSVRAHLHLLQALRHRHRGHGRELSQRRADHGAGRLRPADHQPGAAGRAAGQRQRRSSAALDPQRARTARPAGGEPGREGLPLGAERRRHGHREARRGHPRLRG
jgi:hypothetical protein